MSVCCLPHARAPHKKQKLRIWATTDLAAVMILMAMVPAYNRYLTTDGEFVAFDDNPV